MFEIDKAEWEITERMECVDNSTYEVVVEADVNGITYWANGIESCGELVDIDASTIEKKGN